MKWKMNEKWTQNANCERPYCFANLCLNGLCCHSFQIDRLSLRDNQGDNGRILINGI